MYGENAGKKRISVWFILIFAQKNDRILCIFRGFVDE